MQLRKNQVNAISESIKSDFASGTHAHATGTGKSVIGIEIVKAFATREGAVVILWLCEQSSVIKDIFNAASTGCSVIDLVNGKPHDWTKNVGSALVWGRSVLILVNRAFLVSMNRYRDLKVDIGLIIHDECHSGSGSTTRSFYAWLRSSNPACRVIGLSATPPLPGDAADPRLTKILTRYTIYDAVRDGVILPLRIAWCPKHVCCRNTGALVRSVVDIARANDKGKIIVWAGTISHCLAMAESWSHCEEARTGFGTVVAVDTSIDGHSFNTYDEFRSARKGIMFCAAKHREGSDIPHLSMAVFVDGVEKRTASCFVQCAGRVLRRGESVKKTGLVLDFRAKDGMELCDRMNAYLGLKPGSMPWDLSEASGVKYLQLNPHKQLVKDAPSCEGSSQDLVKLFVRDIPTGPPYSARLRAELDLIETKKVARPLIRALEILKLAGSDIPHVTRGSSGSSLVCYLLGISHVDPVKHAIRFSRFLSPHKDNLPDVDFDFPHSDRGEIFLKIALKWPGKVARISNHVHYHEKSAIRQSLKLMGIKSTLPVCEQNQLIANMDKVQRLQLKRLSKGLLGKFNCYSLHCGGIVYYPDGIPKVDVLVSKSHHTLTQVKSDKRGVSSDRLFKIDVLSSRALSQLMASAALIGGKVRVRLEDPPFTEAMKKLLAEGDTIGVTLAESSLCRQEFRSNPPENIEGIAQCIARIRPAARQSNIELVYDDDVIDILSDRLSVDEYEADRIRRLLGKDDAEAEEIIKSRLGEDKGDAFLKDIGSTSLYGFCKAHAMSYAQIIAWNVWMKAHYPHEFWVGALTNCESAYRRWVHLWEAHNSGVNISKFKRETSIYSNDVQEKISGLSYAEQLLDYGLWDFELGFYPDSFARELTENRIELLGVVASFRGISATAWAMTLGTPGQYHEVTCKKKELPIVGSTVRGVLDTTSRELSICSN